MLDIFEFDGKITERHAFEKICISDALSLNEKRHNFLTT